MFSICRVATVYPGKSKDQNLQAMEKIECIIGSPKIFGLWEKIISFFLCVPCVVPDRILPANYFSPHKSPGFSFPLRDEMKYHSKDVDLTQHSIVMERCCRKVARQIGCLLQILESSATLI